MSDTKQYRIIAASDADIVGSEVDFGFITNLRSTGWGYKFISDRQTHLLHRETNHGNSFVEVSHLSMEDTLLLVKEGN